MKIEFKSIKKTHRNYSFFAIIPIVWFVKDMDDKIYILKLYLAWAVFGIVIVFKRTRQNKKFAVCRFPSYNLTVGKTYQIIDESGKCYVVNRDNGSTGYYAKSKFYNPYKKSK